MFAPVTGPVTEEVWLQKTQSVPFSQEHLILLPAQGHLSTNTVVWNGLPRYKRQRALPLGGPCGYKVPHPSGNLSALLLSVV